VCSAISRLLASLQRVAVGAAVQVVTRPSSRKCILNSPRLALPTCASLPHGGLHAIFLTQGDAQSARIFVEDSSVSAERNSLEHSQRVGYEENQ
jgi:hypothetical protein